MALFSYSAIDANNTAKEGILDEQDKTAVARRLMQLGLRPLAIHRYREPKQSVSFLKRLQMNKIGKADIDFFTKQIALLLTAGLSLDSALRVMGQHSHKPVFREFTGQIERKLKEGKSFSQALSDYPKYFSSMYINIARAGEEGGILPAMLVKISEYQATFQELRQFIISASIYPLILMVVGAVAIIILLTTILPRFEILFEGMGRELPVHVRMLMDTAKLVSNHMVLTFLLLAAPPLLLYSYWKTEAGKMLYDRLAIKLPIISGFIRELETTRIFRTLEVLVNNGVHLATALKISSGVAANLAYQQLLNRATEALKEGQRIGKKLKESGLLPDLAADLLSIGEESGRVGQVCGQIADHYENELRIRIKRFISLLEPFFILFLALIAGWVVISMLTIILSINEIAG